MKTKQLKQDILNQEESIGFPKLNDFCGYLALNALSFNFTIYNILNNRGKWQNLKQEKFSVGRKRILKNISLLFSGVNVNVIKRTSLHAL